MVNCLGLVMVTGSYIGSFSNILLPPNIVLPSLYPFWCYIVVPFRDIKILYWFYFLAMSAI